MQLVRDPNVQADLSLSAAQRQAIGRAYAKIESPLWLVRDAYSGAPAEEKSKLTRSFAGEAHTILSEPQRARLQQLILQADGWRAVTSDAVVAELRLSASDRERIGQIIRETQAEIQKASNSAESAAAREQVVLKLRKQEGTAIQQALSNKQRQRLAELVGAPYDLSQVRPLTFAAPDLKEVDEWINSKPLKLSDVRGQVVAFHFWAFGCINCVHNLPHYAVWHEKLAPKGLVVLGMHTPETQAERSVDALRRKVAENAIRYPVAVDHDSQNWKAWANSMWPSVYLVDKRGQVRYWWYGELNWQGAEGEKFMRRKIEQLLAEE